MNLNWKSNIYCHLFVCRYFLWIQVQPVLLRMSLMPWQLRSPLPFWDSLTTAQWIWAQSTRNSGRVFRSVLFQSVSGVDAEVSGDTNISTFTGCNVFWPVWWKQHGPWAVSIQIPRQIFPQEMYLEVSLICCWYKFLLNSRQVLTIRASRFLLHISPKTAKE